MNSRGRLRSWVDHWQSSHLLTTTGNADKENPEGLPEI